MEKENNQSLRLLFHRMYVSCVCVSGGGGGGWGYSHILAVRVCAAGKGMVFKPFSLV